MTLSERLPLIVEAFSGFQEIIGTISKQEIEQWIRAELGDGRALDDFVTHGSIQSRAFPLSPVLAIISGNAPHSGLQTLLRCLVVGAKIYLKIPSAGIPELSNLLEKLPSQLRDFVTVSDTISETWWNAPLVIAFGSDETMRAVHARLSFHQRFIAHGHKFSIGITFEDSDAAAEAAARDICLFNQQGCLSALNIFVNGENDYLSFAEKLHLAMLDFEASHPRGPISLSESGAITNLRETIRYQAANDGRWKLYESHHSTAHTVIASPDTQIEYTPLNRTVYVKPLSSHLDKNCFGNDQKYISSVGVYPYTKDTIEKLVATEAPRICELGNMQQPTLFWHHDGLPTLASLVTWRDLG